MDDLVQQRQQQQQQQQEKAAGSSQTRGMRVVHGACGLGKSRQGASCAAACCELHVGDPPLHCIEHSLAIAAAAARKSLFI
jgi:hypothetical protein